MCGMIYSYGTVPFHSFEKALDRMGYRGPDHREVEEREGEFFGHVRLPLQTSREHEGVGVQPFQIRDDLMCMFVGEFFGVGDETEWIRGLFKRGHGYHDFERALHDVDGFWAVVVSSGFLTRIYVDHLGIKPMYWWPRAKMVASEITPMLAAVGTHQPVFDEHYLSTVLKFGYDYSGRTSWEGIVQIPPGHCLEIDLLTGEGSLRAYWDWEKVSLNFSIMGALNTAISNRIKGTHDNNGQSVPGMLLSGGLDSWTMYKMADNMGLMDRVQLVHIENGEDGGYLPDVPMERIELQGEYSPSLLEDAVQIMESPVDLGSVLPQILMARRLKELGVTMVLTGDGADELFGGYRRAKEYDSQHSDVFSELPYYHLPRLDRVHMRYTQEVRSPYLSPAVCARALKIPREIRTEKQVLKQIAQEVGVPWEVIHRPKLPLKSRLVLEDSDRSYYQVLNRLFRNHFEPYKNKE